MEKLAKLTGIDPSQIEVVSCVEGSVVMWIRFNLDDTKLEGDCIEKVTTKSNGALTQALKYQVMAAEVVIVREAVESAVDDTVDGYGQKDVEVDEDGVHHRRLHAANGIRPTLGEYAKYLGFDFDLDGPY